MRSRVPLGLAVGLVGFAAYVVAVVTLADHVLTAAWPWQALYFAVVGFVWVFPVRWLMLWSARLR